MNDFQNQTPVQDAAQQPGTQELPPRRGAWRAPRAQAFDPRRKSPALAACLSCAPGLGQVYVGYYQRGFIHAVIVAGIIAMFNMDLPQAMYPLLGVFIAFFWLYNIIDAGRRAALYNHSVDGLGEFEMPSDFRMPSFGGSIALGAVIVIASCIILTNTLFGYSLEWLEEWWPVIPFVFGIFLLVRGIMDRLKEKGE
jgi:hypothetical protein